MKLRISCFAFSAFLLLLSPSPSSSSSSSCPPSFAADNFQAFFAQVKKEDTETKIEPSNVPNIRSQVLSSLAESDPALEKEATGDQRESQKKRLLIEFF